ncbi:Nuf2 family-domain-containing protein [Phlyctochytrium arcticum]|nr:Nuf2 family-domain-containing protein [Phlyctochytrium arcticum]
MNGRSTPMNGRRRVGNPNSMSHSNTNNQPPPGSFSFPVLKPSELLGCMADLGIPFSSEDLQKPSPDRIIVVYEHFTEILMGVTREQYLQPSFDAVQFLEYPDLHQESIGFMAFNRQLRKLMLEVGVDDFSLRDILHPEPGRVRRCLSAIINFAKFREERMGVFEQCNQKAEEALLKRDQLEARIRDLSEKVNSLRLQRAEQEPQAQALRDRNSELTSDLRELKKIQTGLTPQAESLKKEKLQLADQITEKEESIANLKQDCIRLESRIVKSPEELKNSIAEMSATLTNDKQAILVSEKKTRDLQTRIDLLAAGQVDLDTVLDRLRDVEREKARLESSLEKLRGEREAMAKAKAELRDLRVKEEQLKRQLTSATEKLNRLATHQSSKSTSLQSRLQSLHQAHTQAQQAHDAAMAKAAENDIVTRAAERDTDHIKRQMAIDRAGIEELMVALRGKVAGYIKDLEREIVAV